MANRLPKGNKRMSELAVLSRRARIENGQKHKVAKLLGIPPVPAEMLDRPSFSGGSHQNDWPCPYCAHVNGGRRQACAKCGKTPANGRMTRADRRERAAEHRIAAILRKYGL
jgi:hypothetical protein